MYVPGDVERCKAFVDLQLKSAKGVKPANLEDLAPPTITLSRQTGSGGIAVAEKLAAYLHANDPAAKCPWTVFDKNLVEKVLEDHHLPARLAQFMPEDEISGIDDTMGEILGLHPSTWILLQNTMETILKLARMGNVILVGRGAAVITRALKNTFHVRLVGSLEKRSKYIQEILRLSEKEALKFIAKEDRQKSRYLKKYFERDVEDPLLYHLTINTDWISCDEAARMIGETVLRRSRKDNHDAA